jgi:hypothetical protein
MWRRDCFEEPLLVGSGFLYLGGSCGIAARRLLEADQVVHVAHRDTDRSRPADFQTADLATLDQLVDMGPTAIEHVGSDRYSNYNGGNGGAFRHGQLLGQVVVSRWFLY